MNLDKTAKALKKINRLYDIINDIGEASATEIDLLKAYAKDLYESLSDEEDQKAEKTAKELEKQRKKEEKKLRKEQEKREIEAAKKKETVTEEQEVKISKPLAAASSSTDTKIASPAAPSGFSTEMTELFEVNAVNELSDKLSSAPITDLTKAMGINERIFTVNELFGGNQNEFTTLMTAINGLGTYDEAKAVVMKSAASKYDWDSPGKQKKARTLIKLIQRRFK